MKSKKSQNQEKIQKHLPIKQISPISDVGFKHSFAVDGSQDMVAEFVQVFAEDQVKSVSKIEFLPSEQFDEINVDQKVVFDLHCKDQSNDYYIIEMQRIRRRFPIDRALAYACRIISNNLRVVNDKHIIPNVIIFCIMEEADKEAIKRGKWLWKVQFRDEENKIISSKITFYFLELSIFARLNIEPKTLKELWMHMMCHMTELDEIPDAAVGNSALERLYERCKFTSLNKTEKEEYMKSIFDYPDVQEALDDRFLLGKDEGIAEERLAMAKLFLMQGVDIELIMKVTGLTEEEIRK